MNNAGIKRFEYDWVLILWLAFEDAVGLGRLSWRVFADQYLPDGGRGWVVQVSWVIQMKDSAAGSFR